MAEGTGTRNEAAMIASILSGDTQVFHDLIRPYERGAYILAHNLLRNEADAEDAAQEAILKAFRHLSSFRSDAKFSTWLFSITLNEARSRLRRAQTVRMESLDTPDDEDSHISPALLRDWREIPSQAIERAEIRTLLNDALESLPINYREVFILREVQELSVNESAEALGISVASVKVRLHRARLMLQKKLAPVLKQVAPKQAAAKKGRWFAWS